MSRPSDDRDAGLTWGESLRRWRAEDRCWSQQELVDQIVRLAYEAGEDGGTRLDVRLLAKWERGEVRRPRAVYRRLLSRLGAPTTSNGDEGRSHVPHTSREDDDSPVVLARRTSGVRDDTAVHTAAVSELISESVRLLTGPDRGWPYASDDLVDDMRRRTLLRLLGVAGSAAAVSPLFGDLDPEERQRSVAAVGVPERLDHHVIAHFETILANALAIDDQLGPEAAVPVVRAQRSVLASIAPRCPDPLRPQVLSLLGQAERMIGWLLFNMGDYAHAQRWFDQARVTAHDAQDRPLCAVVLGCMSQVAVEAERPGVAIDYAVAADRLISSMDDPIVSASVSDKVAIAFAGSGEDVNAMRHLDETVALHLPSLRERSAHAFWGYNYGLHAYRRGQCLIQLGHADKAIEALAAPLNLYEQGSPGISPQRDQMLRSIWLSRARAAAGEPEAAVDLIHNVVGQMPTVGPRRLVKLVSDARTALEPWSDLPTVKQLDDRLLALTSTGSARTRNRPE